MSARGKAPSVEELNFALTGQWIRVQLYCSRERFRWGILRWHRKALIRAEWAELERIWRGRDDARADGWAQKLAWLESNDLPQAVIEFDPTERLHGIDYDWCPRSEPDALDRIALANMFSVEDRIGRDRLRAAGWIVDDQPNPPCRGEVSP
jgi:hypothetical protein